MKSDPKLLYKYINGKNKVDKIIRAIKDPKGKVIVDQSDIVNEMNNYFKSVFTIDIDTQLPEFLMHSDLEFSISSISVASVKLELEKLDIKKSIGFDGVHRMYSKSALTVFAFRFKKFSKNH